MDSLGLHPHDQLDGWIRLHVLVVSLADDSLVLVCLLLHFVRKIFNLSLTFSF